MFTYACYLPCVESRALRLIRGGPEWTPPPRPHLAGTAGTERETWDLEPNFISGEGEGQNPDGWFPREDVTPQNLPLCPATVGTDLTVSVEKPRIKCSMAPDCFLLQAAGTAEDPTQKRHAPLDAGGAAAPLLTS
ncbi:uncharacterized protein M6G45_009820 [Spheniscus humboldti]